MRLPIIVFLTAGLISCAHSMASQSDESLTQPNECTAFYCKDMTRSNVWMLKGGHQEPLINIYSVCPIELQPPNYYVDYHTKKRAIVLEVGDFVVDTEFREVGLLLYKFNVIDNETYPPIYAWDIMWSGMRIACNGQPRRAPYTEESLKNMILEGALLFYKNN